MPGGRSPTVAVEAVDEVGNPTILATLAVLAAILPMAFVGGLMGPYMRPIPIGASAAMIFSLIVAFLVTPWAAVRLLKVRGVHVHGEREDFFTRLYRRVMGPLLHRTPLRWGFLGGVVFLLLARLLAGLHRVRQGQDAALRQQERVPGDHRHARGNHAGDRRRGSRASWPTRSSPQPEVINLQTYVGTAAPYNFNGLVRHYFLRQRPNVADIQVNLLPKGERDAQSHEIAKRVRRAPDADRRAHTGRASRWPKCRPVRRCCKRWWRKSMGRRKRARSSWPARSGTFSRRPTASWTWTGTWKTISPSTR